MNLESLITDNTLTDFLLNVYFTEDTNQVSNENDIESILNESINYLNNKDVRLIYCLIIDWADKIGFYITISSNCNNYNWYIIHGRSINWKRFDSSQYFDNRESCMVSAIQKLNELYNNKMNYTTIK